MSLVLPVRVEKPWGHEEIWARTEHYVGKLLVLRKGHRLSLQHHEVKEETLRLLTGRVEVELGPSPESLQQRVLEPGDRVHLPPRTVHRFKALEDSVLLEVSTPELDDVVRHRDDYGRTSNLDLPT
jgi:mannose-6-phosphate isomerase-like protein (cupin superfamily)